MRVSWSAYKLFSQPSYLLYNKYKDFGIHFKEFFFLHTQKQVTERKEIQEKNIHINFSYK